MRGQTFNRGNFGKSKPYAKFGSDRGKGPMGRGSTFQSGGNTLKCFNCGGAHFRKDCPQVQQSYNRSAADGCYVYGRKRHLARDCWYARRTTEGASVNKPMSRGTRNPSRGNNTNNSTGGRQKVPAKVFAMSGAETTASDDLIQGKCYVQSQLVDVLYDSGHTHSFISHACIERLGLDVSILPYDVVVSTPTGKPVTTSQLVSGLPLLIEDRSFVVDLICLPLLR